MESQNRVALILGAGPNVGMATASKFANSGYKVTAAARSLSSGLSEDGMLNIRADLSDPRAILQCFQQTKETFGIPNILIYNVANRHTTPPEDPLAVPLETLDASRKASLDSAYVAAQEALKGFRELPSAIPTAFIYTGNTLNQIAIPGVLPHALGKVSAAMLIEYAANAYGKDGYRFYYADEREPNGKPVGLSLDGSAHADMYYSLAHEPKQSKWQVTFVKGEGRRDFAGYDWEGETRADYDRKFGRT